MSFDLQAQQLASMKTSFQQQTKVTEICELKKSNHQEVEQTRENNDQLLIANANDLAEKVLNRCEAITAGTFDEADFAGNLINQLVATGAAAVTAEAGN
jgi:restriction endonuclease Mrr